MIYIFLFALFFIRLKHTVILAVGGCYYNRAYCKGKRSRNLRCSARIRRGCRKWRRNMDGHGIILHSDISLLIPAVQPSVRPLLRSDRCHKKRDGKRQMDMVCDNIPDWIRIYCIVHFLPVRAVLHRRRDDCNDDNISGSFCRCYIHDLEKAFCS